MGFQPSLRMASTMRDVGRNVYLDETPGMALLAKRLGALARSSESGNSWLWMLARSA